MQPKQLPLRHKLFLQKTADAAISAFLQNQNKMEIQNTQPEQNCMDLLAAASAYVYRDEALMPITGGFLADLRHVEDNYLEGTCLGSLSLYACMLSKPCRAS